MDTADTCANCEKLRAELADLRLTLQVGGDALRAFTRAGKPLYPGEAQEMAALDKAVGKAAKRRRPMTPPRYDEVYFDGVRKMNGEGT